MTSTFDSLQDCYAQEKKRDRRREREGGTGAWKKGEERLSVRLQLPRLLDEREKKEMPGRDEPRYRSQRSTCDLERDHALTHRASRGRNPPAHNHVVLGEVREGGRIGWPPRASFIPPYRRAKRARRRRRENEGRYIGAICRGLE